MLLMTHSRSHCHVHSGLSSFFSRQSSLLVRLNSYYGGLPSHPGHAVMRAQVGETGERGGGGRSSRRAAAGTGDGDKDGKCGDGDGGGEEYGGMLSFQVRGGREAAVRVAAAMKVFKRATSLGGTESLIEHRSSIEPPDSPTPDNLLRASVGLEHSDDLLDDLEQALAVLEC